MLRRHFASRGTPGRGVGRFAGIRGELEAQPALDGGNLGVGQAGVEFDVVAGDVLAVMVLGAAELFDQFLPDAVIHLIRAFTWSAQAQLYIGAAMKQESVA